MGEQQKANQAGQDLNHVLKARRDKLAQAPGRGKGSVSHYKVRGDSPQRGD